MLFLINLYLLFLRGFLSNILAICDIFILREDTSYNSKTNYHNLLLNEIKAYID